MNRSLITGMVIGGIAVTAGGAVAGYRMLSTPRTAQVVSVKAVSRTVTTPERDCYEAQITHEKPPRDGQRLVGTGLGAVVGGLLGHEVGGGSGKVLATVAGAAAGGYAGNRIEQKMQHGNTYTTDEQHCRTIVHRQEVPAGYDVVYVLDGQRHHVRMKHDPGKEIPVKDGHIVADTVEGDAPPGERG